MSLAPQGQLERKGASHEEDDSNQEHRAPRRPGGWGLCPSPSRPSRAQLGSRPVRPRPRPTQIKHPKLKDGVLSIEGTKRSDRIALRLQAGDPGVLQLDVGDDGSADFDFARDRHRDESSSMPMTATISSASTRATGSSVTSRRRSTAEPETTAWPEARAPSCCSAATGTTPSTATAATTWRSWAPATTPSSGIPATAATSSRARTAPTRCSSTAQAAPSRSICRRTATASGSSATQATITMDTRGVERVDFNALGGADVVTVNDLTGTDVTSVNVDLAGTLGGAAGDGQPDRVVVNGDQRQRRDRRHRRRRWREGERSCRDGRRSPTPRQRTTGSRSTPSRDGRRGLRRTWPPVRSSSSWTAFSSRSSQIETMRGPSSGGPARPAASDRQREALDSLG